MNGFKEHYLSFHKENGFLSGTVLLVMIAVSSQAIVLIRIHTWSSNLGKLQFFLLLTKTYNFFVVYNLCTILVSIAQKITVSVNFSLSALFSALSFVRKKPSMFCLFSSEQWAMWMMSSHSEHNKDLAVVVQSNSQNRQHKLPSNSFVYLCNAMTFHFALFVVCALF